MKDGTYHSVAPCCVSTEEAMRDDNTFGAHQTRPRRVHNKDVCTTKEFCINRDFSISTDLDSDKKKKKNPRDLGHLSSVSELRYTNYLELNVWYKHHSLVLGLRFMIT